MRHMERTTIIVLAAFLSIALMLGCSGDDPLAPEPEPEPEPVPTEDLAGDVALPDGWAGDLSALTVLNGLESGECSGDGTFALKVHQDMPQFAMVRGPDGHPLLLGWFGEDTPTISVRTTAEVLTWFALGAWILPEGMGDEVRDLLADPATDLSALEAAWVEAVAAQPGGIDGENTAVRDALQIFVEALTTEAGAKGVIIEPGEQQSGIDVLNQGGVNKITIMNSYRRRAIGFMWRESWEDTNDFEHEYDDDPILTLEIPPTDAYSGALNTILGYITGNTAYNPKSMPPVQMEHHPESVQTNFRFNVLGIGMQEPDDISLYSSWELEQGEWMAMKCICLDYFLPMFLNIAGAAGTVASSIFEDVIPGQVNDFISYVGTALPNFHTQMQNGNWQGALLDLWTATLTTGTTQTWVLDLVEDGLQAALFTAEESTAVMSGVNGLFAAIGIVDIIGNLFDNMTFGYHIGECKTAESWEIAVTIPRVHIEPREASMMSLGSQMLTMVVDDDTGTHPEGWSYAYHWTCTGRHGVMYNPRDMADMSNDFLTSSEFVQYIAENGSQGDEEFTCEVYVQLGGEQTFINDAEAGQEAVLHVIRQHIVLADTMHTCPSGYIEMRPYLDPPYDGEGTLLWTWDGGGTNGFLRGPGMVAPPWTSTDNLATFRVDSAGGNDQVTCIASIDYGGVVVAPVDTAEVYIEDVGGFEPYFTNHFCYTTFENNDGSCTEGFRIVVGFEEIPGVLRYRIHGTGFNDPWYYGSEYDNTIRAQYLERREGMFIIGLTSGGGTADCDNPTPEDELCSQMWRFAGAVWEITPVCP